ncbi:P-loop containing nucleoside triphosphate hydrolase protein [Schizophyllum amplum]|uniref:Structural maintenance of chromosomes protein 5 n=1 Tax=Schizophyllum amplum TaxID=97359 RepID=A0A550CZ02_9AGAR|nr:P-loop containing nucleoside triphosphate hydrolase protein [Auriculariopsis ampla]
MTRRAAESPDNESLKENAGPSRTQVKSETKVKEEGSRRGQQQREAPEQTPDAEGDDDEEDGSPKGRKRARVNTDGESRPTGDDGEEEQQGVPLLKVKTQPRDDDGYIPGSIVRIQLHNFVTYDDVEFRPGPYLNMILGPNGTGKSSIACAICLGLNWPPAVLGRATDVPSFVKNNAVEDTGFIEIELKGPKGKDNLVIRRTIHRNNRASMFTLNGQSKSGKEIGAKMAELNVQVGNLCSFLPQDKVSEFAAMSPQQLLRETQRAAGDENLEKWHDDLITFGKTLRGVQDKLAEELNQLNQMKERNEAIERDVKRFLERKEIENAITFLKVMIPTVIYDEMRQEYASIKLLQRKQHKRVAKLKDKNAPAHTKLGELKQSVQTLVEQKKKQKDGINKFFTQLSNATKKSEEHYDEAEEINRKLEEVDQEEKGRLSKIRNAEHDIAKIDEKLKEEVKVEDPAAIEAERRAIDERDRVLRNEHGAIRDRLDDMFKQRARRSDIAQRKQHELNGLAHHENMQLVKLKNMDRDAADSVVWLRQNRDKFRMEVVEPAFISLSVVKAYNGRPTPALIADAVDACLTGFMPRTFVAQCQEDADTLNHWVNDTDKALNRKGQISVWFKPHEALSPPPVPAEQLPAMGFEGYALDFVKCPDAMRWYLSSQGAMHAIPIALSEHGANMRQMSELVGSRGGGSYIVEHVRHNVTRSRYGRRAPTTSTYPFGPAAIFVLNAQVDEGYRQRLSAELAEARQEVSLLDEQIKTVEAEAAEVNARIKELNDEKDALNKRKKAIDQAKSKKAQLQSQKDTKTALLRRLKNAPSADEKRARLKKDLLDLGKKRIKLTKEIIDLARTIRDEQTKNTSTGLKLLQAEANRDALERLCKVKDDKFQKALAEFHALDKKFVAHKAATMAALENSRQALLDIDPEIQARYTEEQQKRTAYKDAVEQAKKDGVEPPEAGDAPLSSEDLQGKLETEEAKLELNATTNPGVVEQYEKRKRDIELLEKTIEKEQKEAAGYEKRIKRAQDNWKPALEKLVSSIGKKFSATFDRIGCAGEVRIREDPDYEKWAIDILVKFRDSEKLQLLTGQRQSGGVRLVYTILYLMSLTEEARAPFSLVDEINQGMDQRAERMVHNSMVEVTCKPESGQYFLITPKLLPDLKYHDRMKILCVNNGEWLPENSDDGNMNNMISKFLRSRTRNASAA